MRIRTEIRCPLIGDDIAQEGCTCVKPCAYAYVVHVLYRKVGKEYVEWEKIPPYVLCDIPEQGWRKNGNGGLR